MSTPFFPQVPLADPRGMCRTCKFFINDPEEIKQEMIFKAQDKTVLRSMERVTNAKGIAVGEAVREISQEVRNLAQIFWHRFHHRPDEIGLCELGIADFVSIHAGAVTNAEGKRIDQCPRWQPPEEGRTRPLDWRKQRAFANTDFRTPLHVLTDTDPCHCGSGKPFSSCCKGRK